MKAIESLEPEEQKWIKERLATLVLFRNCFPEILLKGKKETEI